MGLFDNLSKTLRQGADFAKKGTELIKKQSELFIKEESIKSDISVEKKKLARKMNALAARAYELYSKNEIDDPEMIDICKVIKTLRWSIDDKWRAIEKLKRQSLKLDSDFEDETADEDWDNDSELFNNSKKNADGNVSKKEGSDENADSNDEPEDDEEIEDKDSAENADERS